MKIRYYIFTIVLLVFYSGYGQEVDARDIYLLEYVHYSQSEFGSKRKVQFCDVIQFTASDSDMYRFRPSFCDPLMFGDSLKKIIVGGFTSTPMDTIRHSSGGVTVPFGNSIYKINSLDSGGKIFRYDSTSMLFIELKPDTIMSGNVEDLIFVISDSLSGYPHPVSTEIWISSKLGVVRNIYKDWMGIYEVRLNAAYLYRRRGENFVLNMVVMKYNFEGMYESKIWR